MIAKLQQELKRIQSRESHVAALMTKSESDTLSSVLIRETNYAPDSVVPYIKEDDSMNLQEQRRTATPSIVSLSSDDDDDSSDSSSSESPPYSMGNFLCIGS